MGSCRSRRFCRRRRFCGRGLNLWLSSGYRMRLGSRDGRLSFGRFSCFVRAASGGSCCGLGLAACRWLINGCGYSVHGRWARLVRQRIGTGRPAFRDVIKLVGLPRLSHGLLGISLGLLLSFQLGLTSAPQRGAGREVLVEVRLGHGPRPLLKVRGQNLRIPSILPPRRAGLVRLWFSHFLQSYRATP